MSNKSEKITYTEKGRGIDSFLTSKKKRIHGRNITPYIDELSTKFGMELDAKLTEMKEEILQYSTDDAGNIDFFMAVCGKYIKYNTDKKVFYYWNGRLWQEDLDERINHWIQVVLRKKVLYVQKALKNMPIKNREEYDEFVKYARRGYGINKQKAVFEGLKSLVACRDSEFDTKPYLLNVLNGTLNLKTGELYEHDFKDHITMLVPYMYDKDAKSKQFKSFLRDTFEDDELIKYVQRLLGYCITGETSEQTVHFFIGNGANGKSTLLSLVRHVLNKYATVIPAKVLTSVERAGSASSEIAQLPHKRFVCCSELNCTDTLNEGKVKIISSGETLAARQLYLKSFTFDPEFKCIIDSNYLPQILGTDHGIWRRIRVVPFEYTVSKDRLNKNLLKELKKDSKAVLAWLVDGAIKYYNTGLATSKAVDNASKRYRKSQDTIGAFIEACLKYSEGAEVRARALYNAYREYCYENLLEPMTETRFGRDFSARGFERSKDKISRKYIDIKLKK